MTTPDERARALEELAALCHRLRRNEHVIFLDDYEVANLRALIGAIGYGASVDPNPLQVANTGDWVGQIYNKLPYVELAPNVDFQELVNRARAWALNFLADRE